MEAKPQMQAKLNRFLNMSDEEKTHFALARRLNYYGCVADTADTERHELVARQVAEIERRYPGKTDDICHYLREQEV